MTATVNGHRATSVRIRKPRVSAAHFDVEIDEEVTLVNPVVVSIEGHEFTCAVISQRPYCGRTSAFLVGGKGGLSKSIDAQHYNDASPKLLIDEILRASGEKLDAGSELPGITFGNWQRRKGQASHALLAITDRCGLVWRSTDAGAIWVGTDAYDTLTPDVEVLDEDWDTGALTIAADSFSELVKIVPGCTFEGQRIEQVTHIVTPTSLRTIASVDSLEGSARTFLSAIRSGMAPFASYRCKVVAQNSDGTLQLKPEDEIIAGRGLDKVPIREGSPGWETKVASGAIVSVAFDGGNWDKPYACLWGEGQSGNVTSMEFKPGGVSSPVCRIGDIVEINLPINLPITTPLGPSVITVTTPLRASIVGPGNSKLLV